MGVSTRCVALAVAIAATMSLGACSKDSKRPAANSASSHASVAPVSSASAPPSTASSAPDLCAATPPPATAVRTTTANGDFNGDGTEDTLAVYGTGTSSAPAPYHVQIELGAGKGRIDVVIADAATDDNSQVKALGGADITTSAGLPPDGSGDEAFVAIGSGASATIVGVFQLIGCNLTRLAGPNSAQPSSFVVGGSVTHLDGLRCDGSAGGVRLVQLSATSDDGLTYHTTESRLLVDGQQFTVANQVTDTIDASDPRLQAFATIDCSGVQSP